MAKILIQPVHTTTTGGLKAVIDGISPISDDLLMGKVYSDYYPDGKNVSWNVRGICRDNDESINIAPQDNGEIEEEVRTATAIRIR